MLIGLLTGCWVLVPLLLDKDGPTPLEETGLIEPWHSDEPPDTPPDDTDTGPPTPQMNPDYVGLSYSFGWDGEPTAYYDVNGALVTPAVDAGYYDERFFISLNPIYSCVERYELTDAEPTGAWGEWTFVLRHLPDQSTTPCPFGAGPLDVKRLTIGVGQPTSNMEANFQEYLGQDYPAWRPYLLASKIQGWELGWAILLELDENLRVVPGNNCPMTGMTCREVSTFGGFEEPTAVFSNAMYLLDVDSL